MGFRIIYHLLFSFFLVSCSLVGNENRIIISEIPEGVTNDTSVNVYVRNSANDEWLSVPCYSARVDFHTLTFVPVAILQSNESVEFKVDPKEKNFESVRIRPESKNITHRIEDGNIFFNLRRRDKVVLQFDDSQIYGVHLFVDSIDTDIPDPEDENVVYFGPGLHEYVDNPLIQMEPEWKSPFVKIKSNSIVYLAAGAVLRAGIVLEKGAENVSIRGRGVIELLNFNSKNGRGGRQHGSAGTKGVDLRFNKNIIIKDLLFIDPAHYTVYAGEIKNLHIENIKSFSSMTWSDGIDMMSCQDVTIDDVFMRNSDDCIAIYGHRWDYYGDVNNIVVKNSILWADKAHPFFVGTHGDYENGGNIIENIKVSNIDILEHDAPNWNYQGAIALNAMDGNIIRNVDIDSVRVENINRGQVFNIRVFYNPDYGHKTDEGEPIPGELVENIKISNLSYTGDEDRISLIKGYDTNRQVKNVTISNYKYQGKVVADTSAANLIIGPFTNNIFIKP